MKKIIAIFTLLVVMFTTINQASAAIPRPEHPRPDMQRENWLNLNGQWQFEIDNDNTGLSRHLITGNDLADEITVPFCPESKLSGIGNTDFMKYVWYRRHFVLPENMQDKRIRLHFGGVDYQAWVYVNGSMVGTHRGSNAAFDFDITSELCEGENEIVVRVFDDTRSGLQPTGKQTHGVSEGCVYTRTTGIWQTVWLEAVGDAYISLVNIVPDIDMSRALVDVTVDGYIPGLKVKADAIFDGKVVGSETVPATWRDNKLVLNLKELHLWEVGAPNLYDLKLSLLKGSKTIDQVKSYFGMRSVKIEGRAITINGKRVFQRLILDQGYYPDGLWTAPTDEALKHDIELSMEAGYNGARLHQKVFEPRFLYWADKLGYLCWGEYTNWGYNYTSPGYAAYVDEWTELILRDRNHPSIIGWCPFNETGSHAGEIQRTILYLTRALDPTRPVYETSGWSHTVGQAELRDNHDYNQDPASFHKRWMDFFSANRVTVPARYNAGGGEDIGVPFMVSEFGGIGWSINAGWGYGAAPKTIEEFYTRYAGLCKAMLDNPNMFGFCYTQLTDIEQEQNGLYFYDRSNKFDMKKIFDATQQPSAFEKVGPDAVVSNTKSSQWSVLIGSSIDFNDAKPFSYTTQQPSASWKNASFDASSWNTGMAPFAPDGATKWTSSDIWLRQEFDCSSTNFNSAAIVLFYDEDTQVYVNGKEVFTVKGYSNGFKAFDITKALKAALKTGKNTIAIHTHQTNGGQRIDAAILTN